VWGSVLVSAAPRHLVVVFQGLARPRLRASLPAVITHWDGHVRHLGGNSAQLDIPLDVGKADVEGSGPVTKVQRRVGVASTSPRTWGTAILGRRA
jgi:hypothetical protein